jgi:hypothetical protein
MADLKFNIFVDVDKLKRGLNGAKKQLGGFEKATKKASDGFKKALGGVGLAVGIGAITSALQEAAKAAVEDSKSAAILANTLRNVTGASDEQIASVEKRLQLLQTEVAIADDELRPAYSSLVGVLKDTDTAYQALTLATDISAGTGKDLSTVAAALSKAFAGNTTSLNKLVPGLDKSGDLLQQLQDRFAGAAKTAADNDPFQRISIIFGELQEQLGTYLLPYLKAFSEYLASEEGKIYMENLVENIGKFVVGLSNSVTWLGKNFEFIKNIALMWAAVTIGIKAAQAAMILYQGSTVVATGATATLGNVMKKSGWLAIALILTSLFADQVTSDIDYGDIKLPEIPDPAGLYGPPTGLEDDPLALLKKQLEDLKLTDTKPLDKIGDAAKKTADRMKKAADKIKAAGKSFRDSVDLALGLNDSGTRFSADRFIRQLQRAVDAAKKLPDLLTQLRAGKKTGSTALANQIAALDPIQGAAIAEGILSSGRLTDILSLRNTLELQGQRTAVAGAGNAVYSININKANITGAEIVAAIKQFERSTGRQVLING